jgi:peroxiredoxin
MPHSHRLPPCVLVVLLGLAAFAPLSALAQSAGAPELPTDANQWINSSPLTYGGMRGKSVFLWYFEETCPGCAGKWPALKKLAEENADRPVLFVAVNSGNDSRQLAGYIKKHKIDWPVIVDPDRSFEQASGVEEISLQNIHQVMVVKPDGEFATGDWDDLPGTVDKAADGAEWKVKYDRLDPSMHAAVRRMEFGDFRPAALAIRNGLKDKDPNVQRAARQVGQQIQRLMQQAVDEAVADLAADDVWAQFEARECIAQRFSPHKLPDAAAAELDRLRTDPAVKQELSASRAVDVNAAAVRSEDTSVRERAVTRLERVLSTYPNTRAAARAKELLESAGAP